MNSEYYVNWDSLAMGEKRLYQKEENDVFNSFEPSRENNHPPTSS